MLPEGMLPELEEAAEIRQKRNGRESQAQEPAGTKAKNSEHFKVIK